jgi:hypothetical protein
MDDFLSRLEDAEAILTLQGSTPVPDGAVSRGMRLFWVQLAFLILVVCVISMRAFCKAFVVKKTSWDDWLMFLAAVRPNS